MLVRSLLVCVVLGSSALSFASDCSKTLAHSLNNRFSKIIQGFGEVYTYSASWDSVTPMTENEKFRSARKGLRDILVSEIEVSVVKERDIEAVADHLFDNVVLSDRLYQRLISLQPEIEQIVGANGWGGSGSVDEMVLYDVYLTKGRRLRIIFTDPKPLF